MLPEATSRLGCSTSSAILHILFHKIISSFSNVNVTVDILSRRQDPLLGLLHEHFGVEMISMAAHPRAANPVRAKVNCKLPQRTAARRGSFLVDVLIPLRAIKGITMELLLAFEDVRELFHDHVLQSSDDELVSISLFHSFFFLLFLPGSENFP